MLALYATFPQAAIDGLRTKVFGVRTPITKPEAETDDPQGTDYLGACSIVEAYIQHGIIDMRPGVALTVRYGILERFKNSPGAMLSEGVYNEKLLHFWMQSNAAKLLVKNRGDL